MKILIIKISALGDVVHSLPVANVLKNSIPNISLHYVVGELSKSILINNPIIDKVYVLPKSKSKNFIKEYFKLGQLIQSENYDAVIDLQGLFKSGLVCFLSKSPVRIGFKDSREFSSIFYNHRVNVGDYFNINESIIKTNLKLGNYLLNLLNLEPGSGIGIEFPLPKTNLEDENTINRLINFSHKDNDPIFVIVPNTTWDSKNYPLDNYVNLINALNYKIKSKIVIIGSASDIATNQYIVKNLAQSNNVYDLTGKTSINDLFYLFEIADLVIGGDTGPVHLAAAINKANIMAIYGASPKIRNGPPGNKVSVFSLNLACQPCFKTKCPLKTKACLYDLDFNLIIRKIEEIYG